MQLFSDGINGTHQMCAPHSPNSQKGSLRNENESKTKAATEKNVEMLNYREKKKTQKHDLDVESPGFWYYRAITIK